MMIRITYRINDNLISERKLLVHKLSDLTRFIFRINNNQNIRIINYWIV
jgi:hypothetical protein